jgi:hypothetical protein
MSMLDRKLYRDLLGLWAGARRSAGHGLRRCDDHHRHRLLPFPRTRDVFYERYRFANLFAR